MEQGAQRAVPTACFLTAVLRQDVRSSGEAQMHQQEQTPPLHLQLLVSISVDLPILFDEILVNLIFNHLGGTHGPQVLGDRGVHGL